MLFKSTAQIKLKNITEILTKHYRGIHKRIDENRELFEFLQMHAPHLFHEFPWISGWMSGQDGFLVSLAVAANIENPHEHRTIPFPRLCDFKTVPPLNDVTHSLPVQQLITAANNVIARWESPLWKDLPNTGVYIHALAKSVAQLGLIKQHAPVTEHAQEADSACSWRIEDSEALVWLSSCGETWSFVDGGPKENRVRFCQGCGKPLKLSPQEF